MNNRYHFVTHWRIAGSRQIGYDIISDPLQYARWWSTVYLEAEEIAHGAEGGLGRRIRFKTKGWLPYTLGWEALTTEIECPKKLAIEATGDFEGRGIWTLEQQDTFVNVMFDWRLTAEKPLLKYLSFFLKPLFSANHRWAMDQGRRGLEKEIARRSGSAV
jgi:hypothetical protein